MIKMIHKHKYLQIKTKMMNKMLPNNATSIHKCLYNFNLSSSFVFVNQYLYRVYKIKRGQQNNSLNQLSQQQQQQTKKEQFQKNFFTNKYQSKENLRYNSKNNNINQNQNNTNNLTFQYHKINKKIKQFVTLKPLFNYYQHINSNNKIQIHPVHHAKFFKKVVDLKIINKVSLINNEKQNKQQQDSNKREESYFAKKSINQKHQFKNLENTNFQMFSQDYCQRVFEKVLLNILKNSQKMPPQSLAEVIFALNRLNLDQLKHPLSRLILVKIISQFNDKQNITVTQLSKSIQLLICLNILHKRVKTLDMKEYQLIGEVMKKIIQQITSKIKSCKTSTLQDLLSISTEKKNQKIININFVKEIILELLKRHKSLSLLTLLRMQKAVFDHEKLLKSTIKAFMQMKTPQLNILFRIQNYIQKKLTQDMKKRSFLYYTQAVFKHFQNILSLDEKIIAKINQVIYQSQISQNKKQNKKKEAIDPSFNIIVNSMKQLTKFLYQIHQSYLFGNYQNDLEKQAVNQWIKNNILFVSFYFDFLKKINLKRSAQINCQSHKKNKNKERDILSLSNIEINITALNNLLPVLQKEIHRLVNLFSQFYTQLNFNTKLAVLTYSLEKKYSNRKHIGQIFIQQLLERRFFPITAKNTVRILQLILNPETNEFFKKTAEGYKWINPLYKFIFQKNDLFYLQRQQLLKGEKNQASSSEHLIKLIAESIILDKNYFQIFIKRYLKFSTLNRFFSKNEVIFLQIIRIKIFSQMTRIRNQNEDSQYLDIDQIDQKGQSSYKLRRKIRKKIHGCIWSFELMLRVFNYISNSKNLIISQSDQNTTSKDFTYLKKIPLFQQIIVNFLDQLKFLQFEQLFTYQNIEKLIDIQNKLDIKLNIKAIEFYRQKFEKQNIQTNKQKQKSKKDQDQNQHEIQSKN